MSVDWAIVTTVVGSSVVAYLAVLAKKGAEEAVKESARAVVAQLQWPAELARDLQKSRGTERQELRFKSYGALWHELRPLAAYDDEPFDIASVKELRKKLTDWYFADCGGLLLTTGARHFYFALQDLLGAAAHDATPWSADRPPNDQKGVFRALLQRRKITRAMEVFDDILNHEQIDWDAKSSALGKDWRAGVRALASMWGELAPTERFVAIQQVGSILRTSMANDVESRLR